MKLIDVIKLKWFFKSKEKYKAKYLRMQRTLKWIADYFRYKKDLEKV